LRKAANYPLFYRQQDGSIKFPPSGIGRYYRDELLYAFEWVRQSRPDMNEQQHARMIKIRGGYEFICPTIYDLTAEELEALKTNCPSARIGEDGLVYPFHYIKEYYDQRALYPKTDTRNKVLKSGINGAWGKTAQSVGGRHGMPPRDASPWYAGVVTAGVRAKCGLAVLKAPWNIIHIATDGLQSDAPLGIEDDKKSLGGWEMEPFSRGVYVKPGIYAFVSDVEREAKEEMSLDKLVADHVFKGKSRGVSLRSVLGEDDEKNADNRNVQEEWFDYLDALAYDCYSTGRPTAILPHRKLLTFGAAASCAEKWPMCGNWIEGTRIFKMNTAGVKRACCLDEKRAHQLVVTEVAINDTPKVLSAKHLPEWLGDNEALVRDLHENQELALAHDWECVWDCEDE
jgi:hypothetical protein